LFFVVGHIKGEADVGGGKGAVRYATAVE